MIGGSGMRSWSFVLLVLMGVDALVVRRDSDTSSGPNKYFLTAEELKGVRNGHAREGLYLSSNDNSITYLANGDKFMSRLYEHLEGTQKGDFLYLTSWELNPDVMLKPDPSDLVQSNQSRLINVLARAATRGVTVHILYSGMMVDWETVDGVCARIDDACGKKYSCVADFRHSHKYVGSSHHKMWMIRRGAGLTAFIGSMDIGNARWDTAEHDVNAPAWKMQPLDPARRFAWHGDMFEIVGSAAEDVLATFYSRWNDATSERGRTTMYNVTSAVWNTIPFGSTLHSVTDSVWHRIPFHRTMHSATNKLLDKIVPTPPTRTYPSVDQWMPRVAYTGTLAAQVVRTFGCGSRPKGMEDIYAKFAPDGEVSYAAAWFKSLREAREYIFVADQFMWFDEALDAVAEAAARVKFVIAITDTGMVNVKVPHTGFEIPVSEYGKIIQHYQYNALIAALERKDPTGALAKKVHMFSLVKEGTDGSNPNDQIYDHEKTLLIDDEFALVGSTGVELVGFTNDAELSVGIYDRTFVTDLRKKIFSEFLLTPEDSPRLATPEESLRLFLEQAAGEKLRVRHHAPKPLSGNIPGELKLAKTLYGAVERDGRCTGEKRKAWDIARNGFQ